MQLSIRGHHQFDLPGQILRLRLSSTFLAKGVRSSSFWYGTQPIQLSDVFEAPPLNV